MSEGAEARLGDLLVRQRLALLGGLAAVIVVSWAYLLWMAHDLSTWASPSRVSGAPAAAWTLVMWVVMMAAMMFPTAGPMIVLHARFQRGRDPATSPLPFTALFALGYGVAWSGYGVLATAAQVGLEEAAGMQPMAMTLSSAPAAGVVLVTAGGFQFTSLKNACLSRCRTPLGFFMTSWREGRRGAFAMGLLDGLFCIGCCWALMAVMFVVGVMNMLWVAALTILMLVEKVGPWPRLVRWGSGLGFAAAGVWLIVR